MSPTTNSPNLQRGEWNLLKKNVLFILVIQVCENECIWKITSVLEGNDYAGVCDTLPGHACSLCLGRLPVPWLGTFCSPCLGRFASSLPGNVCQCPAWACLPVPAWERFLLGRCPCAIFSCLSAPLLAWYATHPSKIMIAKNHSA